MYTKLLKNTAFLKNLRSFKRTNYGGHHLSPLETDVVNRNTMDFLPKPKGSWKELNDKRQQVNNLTLAVGVVLFVSGLVGTYNSLWSDVFFSAPKNRIASDFPGAKFVE